MTLPERLEVIFVGGTRFSGAETMADRLAVDREATRIPLAARFHSDPWGIPALLHGRIGFDDFTQRLRATEIAERVPPERLDAALATLRSGYHTDPLQSCRELFWALIGELVSAPGDGTIVEASPGNLLEAQTLTRLIPQASFVHVVRDGRDVAAAAVESEAVDARRMPAGLEWWAGELRQIERGVRGEEDGARYAIPEERLSVVVSDGSANDDPGRWRGQARGPARWWTTRRYDRLLAELEAEGNHAAPALRAAHGMSS